MSFGIFGASRNCPVSVISTSHDSANSSSSVTVIRDEEQFIEESLDGMSMIHHLENKMALAKFIAQSALGEPVRFQDYYRPL